MSLRRYDEHSSSHCRSDGGSHSTDDFSCSKCGITDCELAKWHLMLSKSDVTDNQSASFVLACSAISFMTIIVCLLVVCVIII